MKYRRITVFLLMFYATITLVNSVLFYWFPCMLPMSNFSVLKIMFIAYANRKYALILIPFAIDSIFFLSALHLKKEKKLFPIVTVVILIIDLISILYIALQGEISTNYFVLWYLPFILIDVFISFSIVGCLKNRRIVPLR